MAEKILESRVCLYVLLPRYLLRIRSLATSKFCYSTRNPFEVVHGRAGFHQNFFYSKQGKCAQNGAKTCFFEFIKTFGHLVFFVNLVVDESLYYFLISFIKTVSAKKSGS